MLETVKSFFSGLLAGDYMPHGHCYLWEPSLVSLHVVSDTMIALAYFLITGILVYFVRKRPDVPYDGIFLLFGAFIFWCGVTHSLSVWTMWYPIYWIDGAVKAWTGLISFGTAVILVRNLPRILALKGPAELQRLNEALNREIMERVEAQKKLQELNKTLEEKVLERTQKLQEYTKDLALANLNLKRSNAELEEFAYIVSHDLREPLRTISGYVQLLKENYHQKKLKSETDDDDKEEINRWTQYVTEGTERMHTLIDDLLVYSRLGRGGLEGTFIDAQELVHEVMMSLEAVIKESKAQVVVHHLPKVWGNRSQIYLVFQNLMSNALKFRGQEQPRIEIGAEEKELDWLFFVSDNGIGIDEQYFGRIFGIFKRLHGQDKYPGAGIGLAICKKIIERHGGIIWPKSKKGEGSTFYFTLPKKDGENEP